ENNSKTMYISNYGQIIPWIYSWYDYSMYDFKGLESGTEVILTIDAAVDYKLGGNHQMVVPIYVDTKAPELVSVEEIELDGEYYLAVTAKDDVAMASVVLMNPAGSRIHEQYYDTMGMYENEDGSWTTYFDVTNLGTDFLVTLCDYGCNESNYNVKYTSAGDNTPDMSQYLDQIFAYRVYDNYMYSDHMYGWVSLATVEGEEGANGTAHMSVWSDDYMEETALRAAEYAGGKIFATDIYDRLFVMEPGIFDRQYITTTSASVMDMTFDDSTDTMYVLAKASSRVYLYTMDLLTGKMTKLKDFGTYNKAPYMIADDDNGTLYAIAYGTSGLYTMTAENQWALSPVMIADEEGIESQLVIKDYKGNNISVQYEQSMTCVDGMLFWAYYKYGYSGDTTELMVIDTETFEISHYNYVGYGYTADGTLLSYEPDLDLVGLLSLQETDFQFEEATALTDLVLSEKSLLMKVGDTATVTVTALPWNYDVQSITWTSADESVAAIVNGKIVAVGAGDTTVTVTADGLSKTIPVQVVAVEGNFHAYSYYSYDGYFGYMVDVDMATMNYDLDGLAPVDFLSGDYNGHDGCFYGYTENGQLYRW
ncbi:MAG: Ig-like domain-containing protein, partial [Oscillospiraceae bacterium]|nr:Ig-like domain-containing protein [Oscillospiraceae bacterium]